MIDINDGGKLRSYEVEALRSSFLGEARVSQEEAELVDPIEWFKTNIGGDLHRFILSHPDRDHMSGIRRVLLGRDFETVNFWDLDHARTRTEADFAGNTNAWYDWVIYEAFRDGTALDGVTWPKRITPLRQEVGSFWTDDEFDILSPTNELVSDADVTDEYNNASYVVRVGQGPTNHVLVPGDVEEKAWNDMIAAGMPLRANVLIASHHGRNSGFSEPAMKLIRPEVVIVSTAKLLAKDDAVDDYKRHTKNVYSTRDHGTISVRMYPNGDIRVFSDSEQLAALHDAA